MSTGRQLPGTDGLPFDWASTQIAEAYKKKLGRAPSDAELLQHIGPGWNAHSLQSSLDYIATSPEARKYAAQVTTESATPAPPATTAATVPGVLAGWDATKWNDPHHKTTKYVVGRILAKYPGTTAGLAQAFPEIQKLYPGVTLQGGNILGLPDTSGNTDVLKAAHEGGKGWWWGDDGGATPATAAPVTPADWFSANTPPAPPPATLNTLLSGPMLNATRPTAPTQGVQ